MLCLLFKLVNVKFYKSTFAKNLNQFKPSMEVNDVLHPQFQNIENYQLSFSDNNNNNNNSSYTFINQYRRDCGFEVSNHSTKDYQRTIEFTSDLPSKSVNVALIENQSNIDKSCAGITAKFIMKGYFTFQEEFIILGPTLKVECSLSRIKSTYFIREFGIIQTSDMSFESIYDDANMYIDFRTNLLPNENKAPDTVDKNNFPFYSDKSIFKIAADESVSDKKLFLHDCPQTIIPLEIDFGCLRKLKKFQKFFFYLLMRYKLTNDEEWKYVVLHTFDWFIYWDVIREEKENSEIKFNYGINAHSEIKPLPILNDQYNCNDDQFEYLIDGNNNIHITSYPNSIFKKYKENKSCKNESMDVDEEEVQNVIASLVGEHCDENENIVVAEYELSDNVGITVPVDEDISDDSDNVNEEKSKFREEITNILLERFEI